MVALVCLLWQAGESTPVMRQLSWALNASLRAGQPMRSFLITALGLGFVLLCLAFLNLASLGGALFWGCIRLAAWLLRKAMLND